MKKERIETLVDSFVDVNGDTRHFVIAAISVMFDQDDEPATVIFPAAPLLSKAPAEPWLT